MTIDRVALISSNNEWSPLKVAIVGRAEHSAFPSEPAHMIAATMPKEYMAHFRASNPFPEQVVANAIAELDNLAALLEKEGIRVYRPKEVNWLKFGGYTGAMPRDALMAVGSHLIESPFAWRCRRHEVELGYSDILEELGRNNHDSSSRIQRAPTITGHDSIYDGLLDYNMPGDVSAEASATHHHTGWAINNSRPAFDSADFMRFGKTILGQLSNVTNQEGVNYLRAVIPPCYNVEILKTNDPHAMHIDATLLPLRQGILVYNPERVTETELRRHEVFASEDWELHPYPFTPRARGSDRPPMYMCSPWLVLNALSIDERRIIVEEHDTEFAKWLHDEFGMEPILCRFQNVNSLGGSFHCATVDLVREA